MKVAFIGLGVMGFPMAGHLAAAGHEVAVFNRIAGEGRSAGPATHGGRAGATVAEAAAGAELVALCVGNDDDVRQVRRRGAAGAWRRARSSSTTPPPRPSVAREMAALAARRGLRLRRRAGLRRPGRAPRTAS